jgi:hypothetical protein
VAKTFTVEGGSGVVFDPLNLLRLLLVDFEASTGSLVPVRFEPEDSMFRSYFQLRRWGVALAAFILALTITQIVPQRQALAQSLSAPAINKYIVAGVPTLTPTTSTSYSPEAATASVGGTYTYVIIVDTASAGTVNITDVLPAGFSPTACNVFAEDGTGAMVGPTSCTPVGSVYGPFSTASNPGKVILYISGTFGSALAGLLVNNSAKATVTSGTSVSPFSIPEGAQV